LIKPGDYLFIQFGHNDEKEKGEGVGAFTTYKASLKRYVEEARQRGGTVVLITPMQRRTFDAAGKITDSHGDYDDAVRQAAQELNAPLIDLHAASKPFYEALGPEESKKAFAPNDGTHHNNYGSYQLARAVVEGVKSNRLALVKYLTDDQRTFDPARPDPLASFKIPPSPLVTETKPLGN
jgi:lysophospholipase L1-like esterase